MPKDFLKPPSLRATDLRFAMRPLREIEPMVRGHYLVKGWLDRATFSVVYGEPNVGKTFFALDLAMRLAAGGDWHGHRLARLEPGEGVLYIAGEGGRGLNNRIEALRREDPELVAAAERAGTFTLLAEPLDLCNSEDAAHLAEAITGAGWRPALIVIDTLARAMGGGDENSGQDMGRLIRNVDYLRQELGAHVMVIHHSGKDAARGARGHSSLRGAVDTEIELTRSGEVVIAETRKQRDIADKRTFAYQLRSVRIGTDEDGDPVFAAVVEPSEAPARSTRRLKGQQLIAMQALGDALAHHGEVRRGDMFPVNRQCVPLARWREYCDRHSLSSGEAETSKRTAFHKAKTALQEKDLIRVIDGWVWSVEDTESVPKSVPSGLGTPDRQGTQERERAEGNAEGAGKAGISETPANTGVFPPFPAFPQRSRNAGNAGHSSVPNVPSPYKGGNMGTVPQPGTPGTAPAHDWEDPFSAEMWK